MKTMKAKRIKSLLSVLLCLCALLGALGCSSIEVDEAQLRAELENLLPKSAELNEIYFGEGLPTNRDENAVRAFYENFDMDVASISYTPVDPACGYENVDDIKAATLEVFTEEYAQILFDRAFTGISGVFDEGTDHEYRETALYAMYMEEQGYLTKRVNVKDDAIPLGRTYDLDSMKITRKNKTGVEVQLKSFVNGEPSIDVKIWLVKTEDGWRLDSPTY